MSTLNPKDQAALDQSTKALTDNIPSMIYQLYGGFKAEGFNEVQAFQLCQTYLTSLVSGARGN